MKKIICLALLLVVILSGCQWKKQQVPQTPDVAKVQQKIEAEVSLRIETTNKLLYYMVKDIVKDKHNVEYMMVNETDQWKFDYTDDSLSNISNKDLFIYLGGGFEPWIDGFVSKLKKGSLSIVNSSRGIKLISSDVPKKYGDVTLNNNPYYWMDLSYYEIALSNIKNAIQEKDPKNRSLYEENFEAAIKKIDDIDKKFSDAIADYKNFTFITVDDSLDYFLKYEGIKALKLSSENIDDVKKDLDKKKSNETKFVLFCDDNVNIEGYNSIIQTYNIKTIKMKKYDITKDYISMLDDNFDSMSILDSLL